MSLSEQLKSVRQIFLDTAPVIYFVEKNPSFAPKVEQIFEGLDDARLTAVVSPITLAECLTLPYKLGQFDVVQIFTDLLANSPSILFYPIDETVADKAAELRARYNLTLSDAFQVAVAIQAGCDAFLTNDIDLKRVTDILILVVSE
jgi:predicted nucleic acid-binding protein